MAHDVFISYAADDKGVADAMCARLESRGIRCWYAPRDILAGRAWSEAILDGIEGARILVVVLSRHSNGSTHVLGEIERAVHKKLHVIPFRVEDVQPSRALELFVNSRHWLDAVTPPLVTHLDKLGDTIQALLPHLGSRAKSVAPPARERPLPATTPRTPSGRPLRVGSAALVVALAAFAAWRGLRSTDSKAGELAPGAPEETALLAVPEPVPPAERPEPTPEENAVVLAETPSSTGSEVDQEASPSEAPGASDLREGREEEAQEDRSREAERSALDAEGTNAAASVDEGSRDSGAGPEPEAPAPPGASPSSTPPPAVEPRSESSPPESAESSVSSETEPNDTAESASALGAAVRGEVGAGGDPSDWFRFTPRTDGLVTATLVNLHADPRTANGGLDGLRAWMGTRKLDQGYAAAPTQARTLPPIAIGAGQELRFEVAPQNRSSAPYEIQASFTELPGSDGHEPNNTKAEAETLSVPGEARARVGYGGDDPADNYVFTTQEDGVVVLTLKNAHDDRRVKNGVLASLRVETDDGARLDETSPPAPTEARVTRPISVTGGSRHHLLVRPNQPQHAAPYLLSATFEPLPFRPAPVEDDTPKLARTLSSGGGAEDTVGYGNDHEDWYAFDATQNGTLVVTLTNRHAAPNLANGNLDALVLLDESRNRLDATNPAGPTDAKTSRSVAVAAGQRILFVVKPAQPTHQAPYDVHATFTATETEDVAEPNDSRSTAHALEKAREITALVGYGSDQEDWYSFVPDRSGPVTLVITNLQGRGTANGQIIPVRLENAQGKRLVEVNAGPQESKRPKTAVEAGQRYFISVRCRPTHAAPYRLEILEE